MSDDLKSVETQVLEIVVHNHIDYSEIGKRVAIEYPAIFLMMAGKYSDNGKIKSLIIQGKMVEAIKTRRTLTGEGLKEAKEYCDALRFELRKQGYNI